MLLGSLLELLRDDIQALDFVGRYGGLVQTVTYKDRDNNGNYVDRSFPVACIVNSEYCNTSGQYYKDLIPNDKLKGVFYFEALQGMTDQGALVASGKVYKSMRVYTGRARLVGWMNTKRVGSSEQCYFSGQIIRKMMQLINTKFIKVQDEGFLNGARVEFNVLQEIIKDSSIFNRYTYDLDQQFLLDPYDYFAIDIEVRATIKTGCDFTITLANTACWSGTVDDELGGVPADYLGDETGTFTGVQKFGQLDCEIAGSGGVSFVVKSRNRSLIEVELGVFSGDIGDTLNDPSKWTTSFDIFNYIGNTLVGDGNLFTFAKLDFANDNGLTNVDSIEIFVEIRRGSPITEPVALNGILYVSREDIAGTLTAPDDIILGDSRYYIAEMSGTAGIVENFFDRFYNSRQYASAELLNGVDRVRLDLVNNVLGDLYFCADRNTYFAGAISEDANGFITRSAPQQIGSTYYVDEIPISLLEETLNSRGVVFQSGGGGLPPNVALASWNGATWDQVGLQGSPFNIIPATTIELGYHKTYGNDIFCSYYNSTTPFDGITRLSYTGDYTNIANWSRFDIFTDTSPPSAGGIGTSQNRGIVADFNNLVNGFPTIYVAIRALHVIVKITAVVPNPTTTNTDFLCQIAFGQESTAGNVDGIGTSALLNNPTGMDIKDGFLWWVEDNPSHIVRRANLATLQVETVKGQYGLSGKVNYIEF